MNNDPNKINSAELAEQETENAVDEKQNIDAVKTSSIEKKSSMPSYSPSEELAVGSKKQKAKMGIKLQVLLGFGIFTLIIIALIWVFQILLLNPFYEMIKINEVKSTADALTKELESDGLIDKMYDLSFETHASIVVTDEMGNTILKDEENEEFYGYINNYVRNSILRDFQRLQYLYLFESTNAAGGTYFKISDSTNLFGMETGKQTILYAVTTTTSSGLHRMIVLETELTPIDSTVETLQFQLIILSIVMIIMAIALAFWISRKISKPIVSINESAKELAKGNYDISFDQTGSREVTELANTLSYAGSELSKVETLRRELVANVSHDLRTPLTMIKGYSEVMRDIPGENTPENLQNVIDESSRLSDLVNDLLDLSKLEAGAIGLEMSRFNLTESIREIINRFDTLAEYNFIFESEEDVYVKADELKISQVLYNLVGNAINYIGEDKTITLRQIIKGNKVRIEVSDTGAGIPADKLKDIWDRYYKVDTEHKRAQVGTGLGLSIVKNILDMHNGTYGVSSRLGEGSTFWFELETT